MIELSAKNTVARRIAMARAEVDWSQADLADAIGAHAQNVARWESGEINLGVDTLERIADAFHKPMEWFLQPVQVELKKAAAKR